MRLTNTAEGCTPSGTTPTTGAGGTSIGMGNWFDVITIVAGRTITSDSTHAAHGALSYKHTGNTSLGYVAWASTSMGSAVANMYGRFGLYWATLPNTAVRLGAFMSNTTVRAAITMVTGNFVSILDSAGATILTSTTALTANTWWRIEFKVIGSATVGLAELKIFAGDSTTATETITSAATFNTGGTIDGIRFGDSVATASQTFWQDDYGVSDLGYLGPGAEASFAGPVTANELSELVGVGVRNPGVVLPAGAPVPTTGQIWPRSKGNG